MTTINHLLQIENGRDAMSYLNGSRRVQVIQMCLVAKEGRNVVNHQKQNKLYDKSIHPVTQVALPCSSYSCELTFFIHILPQKFRTPSKRATHKS